MARRLNQKQLLFIQLYLGSDDTLAGNATACYREAYKSEAKSKSVQVMASKLMQHPRIKAVMDRATTKAVEAVNWNAATVLAESVRLYDRCMGDTFYPVEHTYVDKKTGELVTTINQERSYNAAGARAALELIGRNTGIQAFQDNVEVSHTHYLEQVLNRRAKVLEGRYTVVPDALPGEVPLPGALPAPGSPGIEADQVVGQAAPACVAPGRESAALPISPGTTRSLSDQSGQGADADHSNTRAPGHSDPRGRQPGGRQKEGPSTGGQPEMTNKREENQL